MDTDKIKLTSYAMHEPTEYELRIAFNGTSYYVIGDDGKIAVIGSLQDCKDYIDNE